MTPSRKWSRSILTTNPEPTWGLNIVINCVYNGDYLMNQQRFPSSRKPLETAEVTDILTDLIPLLTPSQ